MYTLHDDQRRTLIDWANGDFKAAKAVVVKEPCVLGKHYHRHKDESFLLLRGVCELSVVGDSIMGTVLAPFYWHVPKGTYHEFHLQTGSILLGVATEEFDRTDEIAGRPAEIA